MYPQNWTQDTHAHTTHTHTHTCTGLHLGKDLRGFYKSEMGQWCKESCV